ncbi:MAG TPA: D-Ala-D-Ala carboxypeptidase family metallohydrolase [Sphingomicrobium sp.]|jgi:hypothetical protein|nr:D-Ala-D-Ala carboxypeptidase family metallohydrolase [Sphingomicrobium sp.]
MSSLLAFLAVAGVVGSDAGSPGLAAPWWNPAAEYVTAGQDEPGYRLWIMRSPVRASQVSAFHTYLSQAGVSYVVPTWQLLRTASQWQRCGSEPFTVPPLDEWANVVNTLRYVRDYVVPVIGRVEAVSAYRNPALNRCAGGAPASVHQHLSAIDLVPLSPISRDEMMARLCPTHATEGPRYSVGLGFYAKHRFHVDTWKFRTWGQKDRGGLACPRSFEIAQRNKLLAAPAVVAAASPPLSSAPIGGTYSNPKVVVEPPADAPDPLAPLK